MAGARMPMAGSAVPVAVHAPGVVDPWRVC